jgi:hypothetical protein
LFNSFDFSQGISEVHSHLIVRRVPALAACSQPADQKNPLLSIDYMYTPRHYHAQRIAECLLFYSLVKVRMMAEEWQLDYDTERPHKPLRYLSPVKYAKLYCQGPGKDPKPYPQRRTEILPKLKGAV